jgi:hypothetical protein
MFYEWNEEDAGGYGGRGGFDPATKESGRRAEGPVKQQRGIFKPTALPRIQTAGARARRCEQQRSMTSGAKPSRLFAAEIPINPSVYSRIRFGPDLLSKLTIHGS